MPQATAIRDSALESGSSPYIDPRTIPREKALFYVPQTIGAMDTYGMSLDIFVGIERFVEDGKLMG